MGPKRMLCAMLAGTALVMVIGGPPEAARKPEPPKQASPEAPWFTREAAAQVFAPDGTLGPLFDGLALGGPAPSPEIAERIAAFARTNRVEIDLEVVDGGLTAVWFTVQFGGCCGYEGADVLGHRLGRPTTGGGCMGGPARYVDDWVLASESGIHMRARIRVNRLSVRWERQATLADLLREADDLLGAEAAVVASRARKRWREIEPGRRYGLEMPYIFAPSFDGFAVQAYDHPGLEVRTHAGRITEVSFPGGGVRYDPSPEAIRAALKRQWGRPRVRRGEWTWSKSDRVVTADPEYPASVTISQR